MDDQEYNSALWTSNHLAQYFNYLNRIKIKDETAGRANFEYYYYYYYLL